MFLIEPVSVSSDNKGTLDAPECPNCRKLSREVDALRREVESLREELRRSKRQAAPFSKDKPKAGRQPPGRKPGHPGSFRTPPPPEGVSEIVRVPLESCPYCGGRVESIQDNAPIYQTDIGEIHPVTRRFDVQRGWCPRCKRRVRSRHPEQTSDANGAAGSQLGPHALALAADLKHRLGISFRKVVDLFEAHFDLSVTPGALVQASHRLAQKGRPMYQKLQEEIRASKSIHADETGWRIAGRSAWLWVFATPGLTLYRIEESQGHEVVDEVLGEDFRGTLVSDGLPTYDVLGGVGRQLCLAHILKRCSQLAQTQTRGAVRFPRAVARLLRYATDLRERRTAMSPHGFAVAMGRLGNALDSLLWRKLIDPDNERLPAHLDKHREHLFTFLLDHHVDPTNNLAERQLRPAVIARKLSAGNRSEKGARTHAILASLAATCRQRGKRFTELTAALPCRSPSTTALPILQPNP